MIYFCASHFVCVYGGIQTSDLFAYLWRGMVYFFFLLYGIFTRTNERRLSSQIKHIPTDTVDVFTLFLFPDIFLLVQRRRISVIKLL